MRFWHDVVNREVTPGAAFNAAVGITLHDFLAERVGDQEFFDTAGVQATVADCDVVEALLEPQNDVSVIFFWK